MREDTLSYQYIGKETLLELFSSLLPFSRTYSYFAHFSVGNAISSIAIVMYKKLYSLGQFG